MIPIPNIETLHSTIIGTLDPLGITPYRHSTKLALRAAWLGELDMSRPGFFVVPSFGALRFRVIGSEFGFFLYGSGFQVCGSGFGAPSFAFRLHAFWVCGLGSIVL